MLPDQTRRQFMGHDLKYENDMNCVINVWGDEENNYKMRPDEVEMLMAGKYLMKKIDS